MFTIHSQAPISSDLDLILLSHSLGSCGTIGFDNQQYVIGEEGGKNTINIIYEFVNYLNFFCLKINSKALHKGVQDARLVRNCPDFF